MIDPLTELKELMSLQQEYFKAIADLLLDWSTKQRELIEELNRHD